VPLRIRSRLVLAATLAMVAAASCTSDQVAAPRPTDPSMLLGLPGTSSTLITCPAGEAGTATGLIGPLGGVLAAGNTRVVIPAGAVLSLTSFTLTVPSSKYVEIEVKPVGGEHFVFELPVAVTLDYGRCGRSNLDKGLLTAWNIDPVTKRLLAPMVSVDDKVARTVTFSTIHFSGYAVAD
jgi:hypothetical protein